MKKSMSNLNVKKKTSVKAILFVCAILYPLLMLTNSASAMFSGSKGPVSPAMYDAPFPKDDEQMKGFAEYEYSKNSAQHEFFETLDPDYKNDEISAKIECAKKHFEILNMEYQYLAYPKEYGRSANSDWELDYFKKYGHSVNSDRKAAQQKYNDELKKLQERARNHKEYRDDDCDKELNLNRVQVEYPVKK